jgi:hypothetical protein
MFSYLPAISLLLVLGADKTPAERAWTDATGQYTTQAALVDFDKETVVLKKPSGRLIALPIAKLSKADQDFLQSQNAAEVCASHCAGNQTWVLRDGATLAGRVVNYAPQKLVVQRRLGKVLVNDKAYRDFPNDAQHVVRKFVEYHERTSIPDHQALEKWATRLRGESQTFDLEGVMLQSENGEMFPVPFFLFPAACEEFFRLGYEEWLATQSETGKASKEELSQQRQAELFLRARAADYQRDRAMAGLVELAAVETGLVDEWQVLLTPKPGVAGPPITVVVPARTSSAARLAAAAGNPNHLAGAARILNRRWR